MSTPQPKRAPHDADQAAARLARLAIEAIEAEVDGYAGLATDVRLDVLRTNLSSARLYAAMVAEQRLPTTAAMRELGEAARRRVHQGLALQSVLRAYRVGTRAIWQSVADGEQDTAAMRILTDLTLRYIDRVSTLAEVEYLEERDQLLNSRSEAMSLFLARLVEGDGASDADVEASARRLGYPLSSPSTAAVIGMTTGDPETAPDDALSDLAAELRRSFPNGLHALFRRSVLLVVPSTSSRHVGTLLRPIVRSSSGTGHGWTAGVGRSAAGARGLQTSIHEAERARALGEILHPEGGLHTYDDVRLLDLFKRGAAVDDFANTVLAPFLEHDAKRRSELVRTLRAYYAANSNRKAAAERLGIHPNTLDYRLRQAERLNGAPVTSGEFSFQFQLALRLFPLSDTAANHVPS